MARAQSGYPSIFGIIALFALMLGLNSLSNGQYDLNTAIWFLFSYLMYYI